MKDQQNHSGSWVSRLALGLGVGTMLMLPSIALAQSEPSTDETIWGTQNSSIDGGSGAASSLLNLIQQGQVGPSQSASEFRQKQSVNLNDAAAAFRAKQLEAMQTTLPVVATPDEEDPLQQSQGSDESPRSALW